MKLFVPKEIVSRVVCCILAAVSIITLSVQNSVAENKRAVIGKDGWLIYTNRNDSGNPPDRNDPGNLPDYKKVSLLDDAALEEYGMRLNSFSNWLAKKKITFLLTVAPNTPTIYPESIPKNIKVTGTMSRLDQLSRFLREKTRVNFLDLRPALLKAKEKQIVYFKTDTHWNALGAFVAYQEIMRSIKQLRPADAKKLTPKELGDFNLGKKDYTGDLAKMLGLQDTLKEEVPVLTPKKPYTAIHIRKDSTGTTTENKAACPGLKLMVFDDSFINELAPYVGEHFCQTMYIKSDLVTKDAIEKYNPDIVLFETAERLVNVLSKIPNMP